MSLNRFHGMQAERLRALHEFPYFAVLLSKLQFYECEEVGTLAIDQHGRCYVNVAFWNSLTLRERVGVLVHEAQHVLRKHFRRGQNLALDAATLNIIGDIEINDSRKMRAFLPEGCLMPEMFGLPADLTFEEYAALWPKQRRGRRPGDKEDPEAPEIPGGHPGVPGKKGVGKGDCGSAADGKKRDYELPAPRDGGPGMDETDLEIVGKQVAEALENAAKQDRGEIPGNLVEWSKGVLSPPVISWQSKLQAYARNAAEWVKGQGDYSYGKLSRFQPGGSVIYPGGVTPVPEIVLMIDTSGSMDSSTLQKILPEARECLRISAGSTGKVCIVDVKVHSLKPVSNVQTIEFAGRGGTDLRVGFDAIAKLRPRPDILVVFTDGETPWPNCSPSRVKTIVALCGRWKARPESVPSWAKTIDIPSSK